MDGADTDVTWDGRGDDGRIVASGAYLARLYVVDDLGNARAVCESGLAVEQHLEMP